MIKHQSNDPGSKTPYGTKNSMQSSMMEKETTNNTNTNYDKSRMATELDASPLNFDNNTGGDNSVMDKSE